MATHDEPMQHTYLQIQLNCVQSTETFDNIRKNGKNFHFTYFGPLLN
jgi:hypothetical protein